MKFTPSSTYTSIANAAYKELGYTVFAKSVSSLSGALTSTGWTNVTSYVSNIGDVNVSIEYDIGRFQSGTMFLEAKDINYWKTNIFSSITSGYVEVKVLIELKSGSTTAADTVYHFAGFIDPTSIEYVELQDSITFVAYTAQDIGDTIPAETLGVQYKVGKADGTNDGLYLKNIPSMYLMNASACQFGIHTVTYTNDSISGNVVWLNDGPKRKIIGAGSLGLTAADGVNQVRVYVANAASLPSTNQDEHHVEKFIVNNEGDALPKQWYQDTSAQKLYTDLFGRIGITSLTSDTLQMETTGSIVAYLEQAANNTTTGNLYATALTAINNELYIGFGRTLYKRDAAGTYTSLTTMAGAQNIVKLDYVPSRSHLWIYGQSAIGTADGYIMRYTLSSDVASTVTAITNARRYFTLPYDSPGYVYGLIYIEPSSREIRFLDGYSFGTSILFTAATLGYGGSDGPIGNVAYRRGTRYGFECLNGASSVLHEVRYEPIVPEWTDDGIVCTNWKGDIPCSYLPGEDRLYWADVATTHTIRYQNRTSTTDTSITAIETSDLVGQSVYVPENQTVYMTTSTNGKLYALSGGGVTILNESSQRVYTQHYAFTFTGTKLYGVDGYNRLYTYSPYFYPFITYGDLQGETITSGIYKILKAFNLVGTVNPQKQAYVYRRANDTGVLLTTGNTLTIGTDKASSLSQVISYIQPIDLIEVSNGISKVSYNGTSFGVRTLTGYVVSIENSLIPTHLLKDVAYHSWQYFKTGRKKYTVNLGALPLFQYEPFDGVTFNLASTEISTTESGVIYGATYSKDGSLSLEVIV